MNIIRRINSCNTGSLLEISMREMIFFSVITYEKLVKNNKKRVKLIGYMFRIIRTYIIVRYKNKV